MVEFNIFDEKQVEFLKGEEFQKLKSQFANYADGVVRIHPQRCLIPIYYLPGAQKIYDVKPKEKDTLVITYPKCGTTWTQEIIWTLINNPNLDHPKAHIGINTRCPFLEADYIGDTIEWVKLLNLENPFVKEFLEMYPNGDYKKPIFLQLAEFAPSPRTMKSHLPLSFLHPDHLQKSKIVYVMRNPKDLCVSYYHHNRLFIEIAYSGTMEDHVNYFVNGDLLYGPYENHLKEAWKMKDLPNFHLIIFEELKKNTHVELKRLNAFLGTNVTDEQLEKIMHYTSFSEMKKRDGILTNGSNDAGFYIKEVYEEAGGFFRKGNVGDHKEKLSCDQSAKIDQWIEKHFKNEEFMSLYDTLKKYSK